MKYRDTRILLADSTSPLLSIQIRGEGDAPHAVHDAKLYLSISNVGTRIETRQNRQHLIKLALAHEIDWTPSSK